MENFFKIRAEKQEHIINAAFTVFGRQGYKKASVADIAEAAGIAKGMVTYYFGSKKNLYLYLCELGQRKILEETKRHVHRDDMDFFDRIRLGTEIKVAMLREYPGLLQFYIGMFREQDKDVAEDIAEFVGEGMETRNRFLLAAADYDKFRENVHPDLVLKFLDWAAKGLVSDLQILENPETFDEFVQEFYGLLDMMKTVFYKEEVLC